jgi:hypothetical protein
LPLDEIPAYKVDLADSLTNLGFLQATRHPRQALASVSEAVQLYGELPEPLTEQMRTNQALALLNQQNLLKLDYPAENESDGRCQHAFDTDSSHCNYIESLQPDLLGEHLIQEELKDDPEAMLAFIFA